MKICNWLGHNFTAHTLGYHFCRRCGTFRPVAFSLFDRYENDPLLRAVEGRFGAQHPAQPPTETSGGGDCSASKHTERVPPGRSVATDLDAGGGHEREAAGDRAAEPPDNKAVPEESTPAPPRERLASPARGGEAASIDAVTVRGRLKKWLETHELTIEAAVKRDGIKLGASAPTLYNLAAGKHVSDKTLENVNAALDQLWIEDEIPEGEVGPSIQVEKLPSAMPPITRTNPIPKPQAPPRCAKTP